MSDHMNPGLPPQKPPQQSTSWKPPAPSEENPGKVLGIIAFVMIFFLQLPGLVLGIIALIQSKNAGKKNTLAILAIVFNAVILVSVGVLLILALFFFLPYLYQYLDACNSGAHNVYINGLRLSCPLLPNS